MAKIAASAQAAVKTCTAGESGTKCGQRWTREGSDGNWGVGESLSALEAVQSLLVSKARGWVSAREGTGSSVGNPDAGRQRPEDESKFILIPGINDRAVAGVATAVVMVMGVLSMLFMAT